MNQKQKTFFAPQLYIPSGCTTTDFYQKALGAVELRRWNNDDGTIHVAELSINGTLFHVHEENRQKGRVTPSQYDAVTAIIGLFVEDVNEVLTKAVNAGATLVQPATDYDYGYRQGEFRDPFGHLWLIESMI